MITFEYLIDAPFECDPCDANVAAFMEATSIIVGRDVVEEFLACDIWSLSEKCEFEVERNTFIEGRGAYAKSYSQYWETTIRGGLQSVDHSHI
jgi:hypothetical protein